MPVVQSDSQATRLSGSFAMMASSTASLIWSHILSGCPSVTDSDVNVKLWLTGSPVLPDSLTRCGPDTPARRRSFAGERPSLAPLVPVAAPRQSGADTIEEQIGQVGFGHQGCLLGRTGRVQQNCPVRVD